MTDTPEEIHPAVALILARLESHPEEFQAKWRAKVETVAKWMNGAEKAAMKAAGRAATMEGLHIDAMKTLLADPPAATVPASPSIPPNLVEVFRQTVMESEAEILKRAEQERAKAKALWEFQAKWRAKVETVAKWMNGAEKAAMKAAGRAATMEGLHIDAMKTLLADPPAATVPASPSIPPNLVEVFRQTVMESEAEILKRAEQERAKAKALWEWKL